ncbi:hypothetical protein GOODEAATRI_017400 [Goodea atripinnis]|uniref:SCP2 domain-containing protein n=1 Tax=Goodea atripinnis TaxID=208336 RepID=A0ABV0NL22_9TELE
MDMLGGEGVGKQCRKADIIADAAYAILSKPKDYTGHFLVDEDVLREHGIKDLDQYAIQPGHPLLPDFFLDEAPESLVKQMEEHGATPAFKPPSSSSDTPLSGGPIESTFDIIRGVINEDVVKSTQGIYRFDLSGEHSGVWFLDLKSGAGSAGKGEPPVKADVVMTMDSIDFSKMFSGELMTNVTTQDEGGLWCFHGNSCLMWRLVSGKLKPTMAFMSGKLRIKGDMTLAIKLEKLMGRMNKAKL